MDLRELIALDLALLARTAKHENDEVKLRSAIFEAEYQRSLEDKAQSACKDLLELLENAPAKAAEPFRRELERRGIPPDAAKWLISLIGDAVEAVERPLDGEQAKPKGKPPSPRSKAILEVWIEMKRRDPSMSMHEASRIIAAASWPAQNVKNLARELGLSFGKFALRDIGKKADSIYQAIRNFEISRT